jgi:hypothetical protein
MTGKWPARGASLDSPDLLPMPAPAFPGKSWLTILTKKLPVFANAGTVFFLQMMSINSAGTNVVSI